MSRVVWGKSCGGAKRKLAVICGEQWICSAGQVPVMVNWTGLVHHLLHVPGTNTIIVLQPYGELATRPGKHTVCCQVFGHSTAYKLSAGTCLEEDASRMVSSTLPLLE